MTTYLHFSESEEKFRRAFHRRNGRYERLCIYVDSHGEPTAVTEVSASPKPSINVPDILCIDKVEDAVCLVAAGALQTKGEEYCRKKGIDLTVDALLGYMQQVDRNAEFIRHPFRVKGALKFRTTP